MKVIIKDKKKFCRANKINIDYKYLDGEFDVISIIDTNREKYFIIKINGCLNYYKRNTFTIIDSDIPNNWVFNRYNKPLVIKKTHFFLGNNCMHIKLFIGPENFTKDDFLLNLKTNNKKNN